MPRPDLQNAITTHLSAVGAILAFSLAFFVAQPDPAWAEDDSWKTYWKNGTRIESKDGDFKIKIGGRVQADFSFADEDESLASTGFEDGTEFRRSRLFIEGTLYGNVEFKIQYDFAGDDVTAKDVFVGLKGLPGVGGIRVGHFKEPFSLEELTSSKYITFLERSMPVEAFSPSRNMGIMAHNTLRDDRFTWAVGAFKDTDNFGETFSSEWNLTARLTGLVLGGTNDGADDGPLLHFGLGLSSRSPIDDSARFRARPQSHQAPRLVDTSELATEGVDLVGLETAFVQGPFWASAEFMQADLDSPTSADLSGYNIQLGWFITGESRPFKKSAAAFSRVKPSSPFLKDGGSGAWEIALRYADLDLTDGLSTGGEQDGFTLAVNWYLNSATRVMFNYASTDVEREGTVDFLLMRFAIDF